MNPNYRGLPLAIFLLSLLIVCFACGCSKEITTSTGASYKPAPKESKTVKYNKAKFTKKQYKP